MVSSLDRRALLMWTGGTVTLAAAGGMVRAAPSDHDDDAYSPWQLWNAPGLRNTPLALVSAAILAANPHDTQPWLFRVNDTAIEIYADISRNLGTMDAFLRELHLGIGCAVENATLAGGPNGYAVEVEAVPGALAAPTDRRTPYPAATLHLKKFEKPRAPDALYRAIPDRHTNRYPYDRAQPLPAAWLEFAAHAGIDDDVRIFLFRDGVERKAFDAVVIEATKAIVADATMIADSDHWFRNSTAEVQAQRDGPSVDAAGLSPLTLLLAKLFPVSPTMAHEAWLAQTRDRQLASAPLTGIIAVRDRYDRPMTIAAGRTWQRLHLYAAANGVAMQPLNQPLEMIDREKQLRVQSHWDRRVASLTGAPDWQATFAFRAALQRSPRLAVRGAD